MNRSLSLLHSALIVGILCLSAGWLGLVERRMHFSNTVQNITEDNSALTIEVTKLEAAYLTRVTEVREELLASGTLEVVRQPTYAQRQGGVGVAFVGGTQE